MQLSSITNGLLSQKNIALDILRLDLLHPVISGNKWYKLKYNIEAAREEHKTCLLSFGGAYSNHLHAMAFAGNELGFETIGIIRGEKVQNETLNDCKNWGMQLHFISREQYKNKTHEHFISELQTNFPKAYFIPEGGNNALGRKGCQSILEGIERSHYHYIACAVGTATTFTGLIEASSAQNTVLGFAAIKNAHYLKQEIEQNTTKRNWKLLTNYHCGGFAKKNSQLLYFMEEFKIAQGIELDLVYNAKMMYGIFDLIEKESLFNNKRILAVHTGGLQGNRSLK